MGMVNKVKSLGARATMSAGDIRSRLKDDHDRFKDLAANMCEPHSPSRRRSLLAELKPILTAHARAEERVAYDALLKARTDQPTHTLAQEGYVEHTIVDEMLAKMSAMDADTDVWLAHARVLRELLTTHIDEEQTETFAELGEYFTRDELEAMGTRFDREKAAIRRASGARQRDAASRLALERASSHRTARRKSAKKAARRGGTQRPRRTAAKRAAAPRSGAAKRRPATRAARGGRRKASGQRSG